MKALDNIMDSIHDYIIDNVGEEVEWEGRNWYVKHNLACFTIDFNDGYIEVNFHFKYSKEESVEVLVYHDNDTTGERSSSNIEKYVTDHLKDFNEYVDAYMDKYPYEDEWTEHGFDNAADYHRYRYGGSI